jgi:molybdate transport system substrate-binding protein
VKRLALASAVLVALAITATAGATPDSGRLTIFAASSLTDVLPAIDARPRYNFAGSDQLAFQIAQHAPADVFAAASPKYPDDLYRKGLVFKPAAFATNRLVVIVPAGNPADIHSVFDLKKPGVRLAIGARGVPIGDYTRKVLAKLRLTAALDNVVSEETDARSIVAKVALGGADAGIVYATDARPAGSKVKTIRIPPRGQPSVVYEIAVVRSSKKIAAARAFVARVLGRKGRAALRSNGFGLP